MLASRWSGFLGAALMIAQPPLPMFKPIEIAPPWQNGTTAHEECLSAHDERSARIARLAALRAPVAGLDLVEYVSEQALDECLMGADELLYGVRNGQ